MGTETEAPSPAVQLPLQELEPTCFPFMSLPAELRLYVYRICLKRSTPILLHVPHPPVEKGDDENASGDEAVGDSESPSALALPRLLTAPNAAQNNDNDAGNRARATTTLNTPATDELDDAPACDDPLIPNILRVCKQIEREAKPVLYGDNEFVVRLPTALHTISQLHQKSRSHIKHVHITIYSHHDILEGFADLVRLGLRYCWGLKMLHLTLTTVFPDDAGVVGRGPNVYANAFHILRWLPQSCKINLEGKVPAEVERIIKENERNAEVLSDIAYQKRQHQMPERSSMMVNYGD